MSVLPFIFNKCSHLQLKANYLYCQNIPNINKYSRSLPWLVFEHTPQELPKKPIRFLVRIGQTKDYRTTGHGRSAHDRHLAQVCTLV